jgi:hypothetical protein
MNIGIFFFAFLFLYTLYKLFFKKSNNVKKTNQDSFSFFLDKIIPFYGLQKTNMIHQDLKNLKEAMKKEDLNSDSISFCSLMYFVFKKYDKV